MPKRTRGEWLLGTASHTVWSTGPVRNAQEAAASVASGPMVVPRDNAGYQSFHDTAGGFDDDLQLCYWCGRYWVGAVYSAPQRADGTGPWLEPLCSWECGASLLVSELSRDAIPYLTHIETAAGRPVGLCTVGAGHYTQLMLDECSRTGIPLRMLATPTGRAVWLAQQQARASDLVRLRPPQQNTGAPPDMQRDMEIGMQIQMQMPPGTSGPLGMGCPTPSPLFAGAPAQPPSSPSPEGSPITAQM